MRTKKIHATFLKPEPGQTSVQCIVRGNTFPIKDRIKFWSIATWEQYYWHCRLDNPLKFGLFVNMLAENGATIVGDKRALSYLNKIKGYINA